MKRLSAILLILMSCVLCVRPARAFTLLKPDSWPGYLNPNIWPRPLNPHNWPFTLVPIPEIATDPNSGVTYGVLAAIDTTTGKVARRGRPSLSTQEIACVRCSSICARRSSAARPR